MKKIVELFNSIGITDDKVMHCVMGFLIPIIVYAINTNILISVAAGFVAGVAKEVYDYFDYGLFDCKDMVATWLGTVVSAAVLITFFLL